MESVRRSRRGFTLAELMIVIAIIAILIGIAFAFVNPRDLSIVEANRNAESIATAAQNRLTALRNAGEIDYLLEVGEPAVVDSSEENKGTSGSTGKTLGGYRYVLSRASSSQESKSDAMSYILPFGSIDTELEKGYYVLGIQSETGMIGEVFYSENPFSSGDKSLASYLISLASNAETRKNNTIGYYQGAVDSAEIAFAQLPTPQLSISNYENLELSVYFPKVQELDKLGKKIAFRVSLADATGEAYENGLTLDQTAIYRTYPYGTSSSTITIEMGTTYKFVLDTPAIKEGVDGYSKDDTMIVDNGFSQEGGFETCPTGKFAAWAKRTMAFEGYNGEENEKGTFKLGDNVRVTVTVYCLREVSGSGDSAVYELDPTYMPRSASIGFNGWFDTYDDDHTVTIACGRHLQNLEQLSEPVAALQEYLPVMRDENGKAVWNYDLASRGKGFFYTDKDEYADNKYQYRDFVQYRINIAEQVKAIDFDCDPWKYKTKDSEGNDVTLPIPFDPINTVRRLRDGEDRDFIYYGNYLTIKHLYVDAPFYAGLFGYAYHEQLYDILLVNPHVESAVSAYAAEVYEVGVGALVGTSNASTAINNCQVYMEEEDRIYKSDLYRVIGDQYVGGLIGFCEDEEIESCSASVFTGASKDPDTGTERLSKYVGGLIGCITGDADVKKCYAAGNLKGERVGGLIGIVLQDSDDTGDDYDIHACYTAGHIERASVSAAGLIGYIDEQGGYAKSALRCYQNYCVVIYGEAKDNGDNPLRSTNTEYNWNGNIPIYGTFEGDGFEWLHSASGYVTGNLPEYTSGGETYSGGYAFLGADFITDNENYFIPQKGIAYAGGKEGTDVGGYYATSVYFNNMKETSKTFEENITALQSELDELQNELDTIEKTKIGEGEGLYADEAAKNAAIDAQKAEINAKIKDIETEIEVSRNKLRFAKQIETLEAMKKLMEQIISELGEEKATYEYDGKTYQYRDGGYGSSKYVITSEVYLSSELHLHAPKETGDTTLTTYQAVQVFYDGKYKKSDTDETTTDFPLSSSGLHTFMQFYNKLKENLQILINNAAAPSSEAYTTALKAVDEILGTTNGVPEATNSYSGGTFYTNFLKYFSVSSGLLSRARELFDDELATRKEGDKYVPIPGEYIHLNDPVGYEMFNYFYGRLGKRLEKYLITMTASENLMDEALTTMKDNYIAGALRDLGVLKEAAKSWTGDMEPYKDMVLTYAEQLERYLQKVNDLVDGLADYTTDPDELTALLKQKVIMEINADGTEGEVIPDPFGRPIYGVEAFYEVLYEIFNSDDRTPALDPTKNWAPYGFEEKQSDGNTKTRYDGLHVKDTKDVSVETKSVSDSEKDSKVYGTYTDQYEVGGVADMRGIRTMVGQWRSYLGLLDAEYYSGAEGAMDELQYLCKFVLNPKNDLGEKEVDLSAAIAKCIREMKTFLAEEWENRDSGHMLYSAAELRRVVRKMNMSKTSREENDEFIVNYGGFDLPGDYNTKKSDDYKGSNTGLFADSEQAYIDQDNGVYNNVFPYTITKNTKYYPFPMVDGMKVSGGTQATEMLFHYGDWLTQDLWAEDPATKEGDEHKDHKGHYEATSELASVLQDVMDSLNTIEEFSDEKSGFWEYGVCMKPFKADIDKKVKSAKAALQELIDIVEEYERLSEEYKTATEERKTEIGKRQAEIDDRIWDLLGRGPGSAYEEFRDLYELFDLDQADHDHPPAWLGTTLKENLVNGTQEKVVKEIVDIINTNYDTGDMRSLRTLLGINLKVLENLRGTGGALSRNKSGTAFEENLLHAYESLELIKILSGENSPYWKEQEDKETGKTYMSDYKGVVNEKVDAAITAMETLLQEVRTYAKLTNPTADDYSKLKAAYDGENGAVKTYNEVWKYFNEIVKEAAGEVIDKDGIVLDDKYRHSGSNGMRPLRTLLGDSNGSWFNEENADYAKKYALETYYSKPN